MKTELLESFLTLAKEGNCEAAAQSLGLPKGSIVAGHLRSLEMEMGKQLMIHEVHEDTVRIDDEYTLKKTDRYHLTREGEHFVHRAEEILSLLNKTKNELANIDRIAGTLRIGMVDTDHEYMRVIFRAINTFKTKYPEVEFLLSSGSRAEILRQLDEKVLDLGFVHDNKAEYGVVGKHRFVEMRTKEGPCMDNWKVLMREDSPLAQKEMIEPEELWEEPLIWSHQQDLALQWMGRELSQLNITVTCDSLQSATALVQEGFGYYFTLATPLLAEGLCLRPLNHIVPYHVKVDINYENVLLMVRHEDHKLSRAGDLFVDMMKNAEL